MFRQNAYVFEQLPKEKYENQFQLLYYQFIKNSFGLDFCNEFPNKNIVQLKLYFDQLPDTIEKNNEFKEHILYLNNLFDSNIFIKKEDIVEVNSKSHVILQCMDIILGAMNFRLNDLHKVKVEGTNKRGKTTIAKEKLYKTILSHIKEIHPYFNIGISTTLNGDYRNLWYDPYRHWRFQTKGSKLDKSLTKKKDNSVIPT